MISHPNPRMQFLNLVLLILQTKTIYPEKKMTQWPFIINAGWRQSFGFPRVQRQNKVSRSTVRSSKHYLVEGRPTDRSP